MKILFPVLCLWSSVLELSINKVHQRSAKSQEALADLSPQGAERRSPETQYNPRQGAEALAEGINYEL